MIKDFPEVSAVQMAFGGYPADWFKKTLSEAKEKGFDMNNCERASELFYNGGKLNLNQKLDNKFRYDGCRILKSVMGSFEPKHEHKMAVCEYIIHCLENQLLPQPITVG